MLLLPACGMLTMLASCDERDALALHPSLRALAFPVVLVCALLSFWQVIRVFYLIEYSLYPLV
jgi:hypothetical protein